MASAGRQLEHAQRLLISLAANEVEVWRPSGTVAEATTQWIWALGVPPLAGSATVNCRTMKTSLQ
eukprot:CAMPEP_0171099568 /NCGR_PEP_ID=MMETSP0766_2-20121228/51950_1 /TAXON_ID=439317 /ORGANISM="Gambierdiscus australes, Strain CAWD 149" /LENGTH=64 /DNA_ID=CAMNT_0011559223 /DNA_START=100 /DNA_END=294 /DNA_ORIENTATION=-